MTLVDVKNALFSHFLTESTFSLKEDVGAIKLEGDIPVALLERREALFKAAAEDFTRSGITADLGEGLYVLTQPIDNFSQQVVLSPLAAEMIADLVNGLASDLSDGHGAPANKLAITSRDIEQVCQFCHFLLDEAQDQTP